MKPPPGLAPPLLGFPLVPQGCRTRMEAGGKLGGFGSVEVEGWDHTLLSSDGLFPLPEVFQFPSFVSGHQDSQQKCFLLGM